MTPDQFTALITELEAGADIALPLLGQAEWVPVVNAAASLTAKIATVIQSRSGDDVVSAAMQAARVAADVAEEVKFGVVK